MRRDFQPASLPRPAAFDPLTPPPIPMTVCPIAIAVGCRKCPAFSVCPLKTVLGDQPAKPGKDADPPAPSPKRAAGTKRRK